MQSRVNYTVVGIFVVVLTTFLLIAIFWLSMVSGTAQYHTYLVYVHEDVTGLSSESPVRFNGVKVGYVRSVRLDPLNPKLVRLELGIAPGTPITTSTYAILNAQGVTGVVYVNLKAETEAAPLLTAAPGQKYPVIPSKPSLLVQLSTVLPEVTKDIQKLSASVAQVLDTQNRQSITDSLHNISVVTKTLADNATDFTETMKSLDNLLANMSEASNHFPQAITQLRSTLTSVDQLSQEMNQTSQDIGNTMKSGQVAINHFSDQVLPVAQRALTNLSTATINMQSLTQELERNPSMLVRGKLPATPGPGEK